MLQDEVASNRYINFNPYPSFIHKYKMATQWIVLVSPILVRAWICGLDVSCSHDITL